MVAPRPEPRRVGRAAGAAVAQVRVAGRARGALADGGREDLREAPTLLPPLLFPRRLLPVQLPALKAAYAHYSAGREGGLSLAQWVRQLVDCGLAVRIKPGQAAAPPAAAAAGLDAVPRQGGAPPLPPHRERPAGLDDMHVRGGEGGRERERERSRPSFRLRFTPHWRPLLQGRRMADVDAAMAFLASLSEEDSAAQQYTPATMSAAQVCQWEGRDARHHVSGPGVPMGGEGWQ